jgi:hypothetical protein
MTPALTLKAKLDAWLLSEFGADEESFELWGCQFCPFNAPTFERYEEIWNDLDEAYYQCPVSGKKTWGERPDCGKALVKIALGLMEPPPVFEGDRHAGIRQ